MFGGSISRVLVPHSFLYPVSELAEVGVDAWHVLLATQVFSKRHEALQKPIADHGAPRVILSLERDRGDPQRREVEIDRCEIRNQPNETER